MDTTTTYYKLDIHGIVYLINPQTSEAYTYDTVAPTKVGKVEWKNSKETPTLILLENWKDILQQKMTAMQA